MSNSISGDKRLQYRLIITEMHSAKRIWEAQVHLIENGRIQALTQPVSTSSAEDLSYASTAINRAEEGESRPQHGHCKDSY